MGIWQLLLSVMAVAREVTPWLVAAIIFTAPFVVYSLGQARLSAALNKRQRMLLEIQADRVEITRLREELRTILSPANLAQWANQHGLSPTSEVIQIGVEDPGARRTARVANRVANAAAPPGGAVP
jgi:hypothetical protein